MVNLYINERRIGSVIVLDLKGRVRIGGGSLELHRAIKCLVDEGKTQILLNLAGVTHIDSAGLGELVSSHVTVGNKGGALKLSHLTESIQELMTITKVLTVFEIHDNESEAVASFKGEVLKVVQPQPFFM